MKPKISKTVRQKYIKALAEDICRFKGHVYVGENILKSESPRAISGVGQAVFLFKEYIEPLLNEIAQKEKLDD